MAISTQNRKLIFGLKVRQLRQEKQMPFKVLSQKTGVSVSYLNEIEKGKKFPKAEKIHMLAKALDTSYEELISIELSKNLQPVADLLHSNFLEELPLDMFGIEAGKVVELISTAPARVGAFISAVLEISRKYALQQENFYFAALRSYQELHNNYFEELETAAENFAQTHPMPFGGNFSLEHLYSILVREYGYFIDEEELELYPSLKRFRYIFQPKKKKFLINSDLTDMQRAFLLSKEIGFNYLQLKERANTSSFVQIESFEQVLNNFKTSYFAGALLMPKDQLIKDLKDFFNLEKWNKSAFLGIMNKYKASPEMFLQRLTNLLPQFFGLEQVFFLRFNNTPGVDQYELTKELHLSRHHQPYGNGISEHYCRRWITLWLLDDLYQLQKNNTYTDPIASAQRSQFYGTDDEYLCFTIARPAHPTPDTNVSVTIGLSVNEQLKKVIRFGNDEAIIFKSVNQTCERCDIKNCAERAAEPVVLNAQKQREQMWKDLKRIS